MAFAKISATVPAEIYEEITAFAAENNIKLSHLVAEALADKLRTIREKALLDEIDKIYEDPEISEEQRAMAESIADSMDVEELPW